MSLTETDITLVKESWSKVVPIAETAADLFYNRLFELDPSLRSLFSGDMTEQGKKLMSVIAVAVNALDNLEAIIPVIQDMGRRHEDYGVKPEQYQTVGSALLWTLEQGLGEAFTASVKEAWTKVYGLLAETMLSYERAEA